MQRWEFTGAVSNVRSMEDGKLTIVRRIRAAQDLTIYLEDGTYEIVPAGTEGGWIENESNLPPESEGWVGEDAIVYGDSTVLGSARVGGAATVEASEVSGFARVQGRARLQSCRIEDNAMVYGNARLRCCVVSKNSQIFECASVEKFINKPGEYVTITDNAMVYGNASIVADAALRRGVTVEGHARVHGCARVGSAAGELCIKDFAEISDAAEVFGAGFVYGHAVIRGHTALSGYLYIGGDAVLDFDAPYASTHDNSVRPYLSLNMGASLTGANECLVLGPFHGKEENMFLTFTMDDKGDVNMYTHRWVFTPFFFHIDDAKSLQAQLCTYGCFADDAIPDVVDAYNYAKRHLQRQRLKKERENKA